jgi:hypothetical protein
MVPALAHRKAVAQVPASPPEVSISSNSSRAVITWPQGPRISSAVS